jgi:hypothetical protein
VPSTEIPLIDFLLLGGRGTSLRCGRQSRRLEAFQIGMDDAIFGSHNVPTRLGPPSDAVDFWREQVGHGHSLSRPDELLLRLGQIACETSNAVRLQPDPPIGDFDVGEDVGDGKLLLLALRASAAASSAVGMVRPSALAVFRLIVSLNLVGA